MHAAGYFRLTPDRGAVPALDGLRGIAILMVVVFHAAESFRPPNGALLPLGRWDAALPLLSGWLGVNLFFVLSGFLITWHLLRRWTPDVGAAEIGVYLTKRWLRIVPTYYVVLLIAAFELVPYVPVARAHLGSRIAYHMLFLQDYLPSDILAPFWSLGVEEKFYLLMPVALLVAWRLESPRRQLLFLAAIAAFPLAMRTAMWIAGAGPAADEFIRVWRNPFHLNLDSLGLGALAAWVVAHRAELPRVTSGPAARRLLGAGTALVAALMLLAPLGPGDDFFHKIALMPLTAAGMAAILLGVALRPRGSVPLLESRWLARAGRIAYPWYLTHVLAMWWVWESLIRAWPGIHALSPAAQLGIFFPLYGAASVGAALALHYLVEKPCLILKDRVGARPAPAPSPLSTETA